MKTRIDGIEVETDGNYKIGYTLCTDQTRKWSDEQINANNDHEHRMIFVNFEPDDQGRSRVMIAKCDTTGQAINVMTAIRTTRLDARFELAGVIHELLETSEYAKQSDGMLQAAINAMAEGGGYSSEFSDMQAVLDARKALAEITYEWEKQ